MPAMELLSDQQLLDLLRSGDRADAYTEILSWFIQQTALLLLMGCPVEDTQLVFIAQRGETILIDPSSPSLLTFPTN